MVFRFTTLILVALVIFLLLRPGPGPLRSIEVRNSPIHGRGVFCLRPFKAGQSIEVVPTIKYDKTKEFTKDSVLTVYDIHYKDGHAFMLGYGAIYNHSDDNNAEWGWRDDGDLEVVAKRDIKQGEEICVNYGQEYWSQRSDKK
jgi:uncharacterized protein